MMALPRLALAVPGCGPEPSPASLGLLAGLSTLRWRVQHFRARACPTGTEAVHQATGLPGRHLDAWLMPPEVCREVFARGSQGADLALVEGTLEEPTATLSREHHDRPGGLGPIAEALDLPTVALLSCPRWEGLHLADLPSGIDAVLIDGLEDPDDFARIASAVRMMTRRPVIGAVEALPEVRQALARSPRNGPVAGCLIAALARSFLKFADLPTLKALANARPFQLDPCHGHDPADRPRFRVAYAQDEAFGGYFPDTLETLEALGADLVEFSPLRSEDLPKAVDLVMIGCGYPDQFAEQLSANVSLTSALRSHVYRGRRIYSEGGGTAYLGRTFRVDGRDFPGVGILPFDAELKELDCSPEPISCTIQRDTWLAPRGTVVRGYRSNRWTLRPTAELCHAAAGFGPLSDVGDFFYHHHAVGSLMHLHLAALPQVVAAFAGPHRPSSTLRQAGR
jgi:cobyrinic acid a,c-diamide synthase